MAALLRDIRLAFRTLLKSPGLSFVSVLALAAGIGLTTMMFSIVYGALLRGLAYPGGDRIVAVMRANPERGVQRSDLPLEDFVDLREQTQSFEYFAASTGGTMNVSGMDRAERYSGTWVTRGIFEMTGVQPVVGRLFREGEDVPGGPNVAILGYQMWKDRFGGATDAVGRVIRVNGQPFEVVGVLPEGYDFPAGGQLYLPYQRNPLAQARGQGEYAGTIAKLKPGVSLDQANAELATLSARLAADYPQSNAGFSAYATALIDANLGPEVKTMLWAMLGAVFFVLLIACSNVANLLIDRAAHRSKEVGVRTALGASRSEIIRVFLSEAFVLTAIGTVLGIVIARFGIDAFNRALAADPPPSYIVIDLLPPVLLFAVGVALVTTFLAGIIPAVQASRTDIAEILKDESRGASSLRIGRLSKLLVVGEIALSCTLLVAAGLMIKSVTKAMSADRGFTAESVFTARVGFPTTYTDTVMIQQFFQQLSERAREIPGVQAATVAAGLPGAEQGFNGNRVQLEGKTYERDQDMPATSSSFVTPGFFETLEIPLRQGRLFTEADRDGALPVAIVNERFVRQHLEGQDALGRRIKFGALNDTTAKWLTIVGVVADVFAGDPQDPRPPLVLQPLAQGWPHFAYVAVRTAAPPLSMTQPIRETVASLNPDLPIYWPMTLQESIAQQLWFVRVFGVMFMIFGFVALFLASIGLYAVMSFSVSRRTREMGIRMALGSSPGRVIRLVFNSGVWQLVIGLGIGLALATGVGQLLTAVLFDVKPRDPSVFTGVALALTLTGMAAVLVPAFRATRVDPAEAMRTD